MNNFGTQNIAVGTPAQYVTGMNWEYLQVSNESGYQLDLNFSGLGSRGFNPWQRDDIAITKGYTGTLVITASNPSNADITKFPSSYVQVNAYIPGELTQPMSVALSRLNNIGNNVSTSVSSTNAISNTGNGPLSNWLTVQPNDALSATFTGDTSGNFSVSGDNAGVLTTLLQLIAGASPAVKIAAASIIAEVLGGLKVDGTLEGVGVATFDSDVALSTQGKSIKLKNTAGTSVPVLQIDNTNSLNLLNSATGVQLNMKDQNGANMAAFTNTQSAAASVDGTSSMTVSKIFLNTGGFKDINSSTIAASGTINHGLSGTPLAVLMCPDSGSSTWTFGASSYTTTQFTATLNSALTTRWWASR